MIGDEDGERIHTKCIKGCTTGEIKNGVIRCVDGEKRVIATNVRRMFSGLTGETDNEV